jgi:hypothetical protein
MLIVATASTTLLLLVQLLLLLLLILLLLSLVVMLAVVTTEELLPLFASSSGSNSNSSNNSISNSSSGDELSYTFNFSYQAHAPSAPSAPQLGLPDFQKLVWLSAAAYCGSEQILRGHSWRGSVVEGFVPTMAIHGELDTDVRDIYSPNY